MTASPGLLTLQANLAANTLTTSEAGALLAALDLVINDFPSPDDASAASAEMPALANAWASALFAIQAGGTVLPPTDLTDVTGTAPIVVTSPTLDTRNVAITAATDAAAGSMSAADKTKLDGLPATGLPIVANLAALAALVVTSLGNGQPAAVQSVGRLYALSSIGTLTVDGFAVVASPDPTRVWQSGQTLIPQAALAQASWWIDPGAGSDEATGAAIGAPLKTFAELVRRLGTNAPVYPAGKGITVTFLTSQPAGTDPINFVPCLSAGGQAVLLGTKTAGVPFVAGAVTAKSQTASQALTVAGAPGGTTAASRWLNTTRGSSAWVRSVASSVATMSQPVTTIATIGVPAPSESNTWATGDSITPETYLSVNLERWSPVSSSQSAGSVGSVGWVQDVVIADLNNGGGSYGHACNCNANVLYGCYVNARLNLSATTGRGQQAYLTDCFMQRAVQMLGGACNIFGGVFATSSTFEGGIASIQGDVAMLSTTFFFGATANLSGMEIRGAMSFTESYIALLTASALWGGGPVNVFAEPNGRMGLGGNSTASSFANAVANGSGLNFLLGPTQVGSAYNAITGVWTGNLNLSGGPSVVDTNSAVIEPRSGAGYFGTGFVG